MSAPLKIVVWPRGVRTCGYSEEALSLTPLIAGWCPRGFYVAHGITPAQLKTHMATIDWSRVKLVDKLFDIKASGYVVISSTSRHFVSVARYQRLFRQCFRAVPKAKFDAECAIAKKLTKGRKSCMSGRL